MKFERISGSEPLLLTGPSCGEILRGIFPSHNELLAFPADRKALISHQIEISTYGGIPEGGLFWSKCQNASLKFGKGQGGGSFLLSTTLSGRAVVNYRHRAHEFDGPDKGMILIDSSQNVKILVEGVHEHVYLIIPRQVIEQAMGRVFLPQEQAIRIFPSYGLTAVLQAHLTVIHERRQELSEDEVQTVIGAGLNIALECLRTSGAREPSKLSLDEDLVARGVTEIARRMNNPQLSAIEIAIALNCSRAHLYRAFARQGLSVGRVMRTHRLERARQLLRSRSGLTVEAVALSVGYSSLASFSRAYRSYFGVAPSQEDAGAMGAGTAHSSGIAI